MKKALELTKRLGIPDEYVIPFGWDKAKISLDYYERIYDRPSGKLILVTAITPTKAGEGKTTTTIGLTDGLNKIGVNALACLREPSLGPVWGIKGGAVGALKATVVPSDDINLHFTGDMHALTSTIDLIAAIIDNHIYQGNELNIDPDNIVWPRALDLNDRALRSVTVAQDDKNAKPHHSEFVITVASELMSILTLCTSEANFEARVNQITVAYDYSGNPVKFGQFNMSKAIVKMMRAALNPNIVQTLEENPVLVHAGPFANVSLGTNSLIETKMALKLAPVVVTEAGFGSDLGAEKFLDIKCQAGDLKPSGIVLVATVRALKLHGGVKFEELEKENVDAMTAGFANLQKHYENMSRYSVPVVVAINRFPSDTDNEIDALVKLCESNGYEVAVNSAALDGGDGAKALASLVNQEMLAKETSDGFKPLYSFDEKLSEKIRKICVEIYGADGVEYSELAASKLAQYEKEGYGDLPVCISKTPNSLSDDPKLLNRPVGFKIHIRDVRLYSGAGLVVPLSGALLLMPGLPKEPRCLDKFN